MRRPFAPLWPGLTNVPGGVYLMQKFPQELQMDTRIRFGLIISVLIRRGCARRRPDQLGKLSHTSRPPE